MAELLAHHKAATAANRYRSLQQLFKFLVEDGEIRESPMARMHTSSRHTARITSMAR